MTAEKKHSNRWWEAVAWGRWSLISLYVSIASGIVAGLQYRPAEAFHSVVALDTIVPLGGFVRSLHFYSSQAFFLLLVIHFAITLNKTAQYGTGTYVRLVFTLPLAVLLLFTGYVLRGDSTGSSAGQIAEEIIKTIPWFGTGLDGLFFAISSQGLHRVYLHHIITFDLLILMLAWDHLRRYSATIAPHYWLVALFFLFSAMIPAPMDPDHLGIQYTTGPWFFLGLQELLRYLPPLVAGIFFPAILLTALCCLRPNSSLTSLSTYAMAGWLAVYATLSTMAWLR